MAVEYDSASSSDTLGADLSWTHTVTTAGSDRIILVGVAVRRDTGFAAPTINSITYAGSALTLIDSYVADSNQLYAWFYYAVGPATGANTVLIDGNWASGQNIVGVAISLTGVDQTTPLGTSAKSSGVGTNIQISLTSETGQVCVDFVSARYNTYAQLSPNYVDSGQTKWAGGNHGSGGAEVAAAVSTEAGASTVNMSWSDVTSAGIGVIGVPLRPAAGRSRLTKYFFNTFDPNRRILDLQGRNVPVSQIGIDAWIRSDGPFMISPAKRATLIEEPAMGYSENTRLRGDKLSVDTVRETMLESLLRRLGARGA